jgi:PleD family two-component response regulator
VGDAVANVKVVIIDKQSFFRAGVKESLIDRFDLEIIEADPEDDLTAIIENSSPEVVLLDIDAPLLSGLKIGRSILQLYPAARLVMLTSLHLVLCAQKSVTNLGVTRIVYIDEISGHSIDQTIRTGEREISVEKFAGVVGPAYFKLYGSLMPEKDLNQIQLFKQNKEINTGKQISLLEKIPKLELK